MPLVFWPADFGVLQSTMQQEPQVDNHSMCGLAQLIENEVRK